MPTVLSYIMNHQRLLSRCQFKCLVNPASYTSASSSTKITSLFIYKMRKKDRHISQTQPCSRELACSRPGPSNSRCVLLSPDTCLPRVGDRGHERWMVGLIWKHEPQGQTMTSNTTTIIIIIIIITSSSVESPLLCVTMATVGGQGGRVTRPRGWRRVRVTTVAFKLPVCTAMEVKLLCNVINWAYCCWYCPLWLTADCLPRVEKKSVIETEWHSWHKRLLRRKLHIFSAKFMNPSLDWNIMITGSLIRSTGCEVNTRSSTQFLFARAVLPVLTLATLHHFAVFVPSTINHNYKRQLHKRLVLI